MTPDPPSPEKLTIAEHQARQPGLGTKLSNDFWLFAYLHLIGVSALLAFGAALMPADWIVRIAGELGIQPFPDSPLTYYLARHLSLLYGFVGVLLVIVARDLERYRPLIRWIAIGTIVFGVLQLVVDSMAGLPTWWTVGEPLSTMIGGAIMLWLVGVDRAKINS